MVLFDQWSIVRVKQPLNRAVLIAHRWNRHSGLLLTATVVSRVIVMYGYWSNDGLHHGRLFIRCRLLNPLR